MKNKDLNPMRLKSARMYRGKTIDELAADTGINRKDIYAFEESKYFPVNANSLRIAKALNFPQEYFYQDDNMKVKVESTHFAVPGSIPRVDEVAYREMLITTHKISNFIGRYVSLPELNLLTSVGKNIDVEVLATKLREHWNLSDELIEDVSVPMEENGIIISTINMKRKDSASFTQRQSIGGEVKYLVALGDDGNSAPRRNYDLAYELGFIISSALGIPTKKFLKDEFACAFLMPRGNFLYDLENPDELDGYLDLKKKWRVPVSTMVFRAHQLGRIDYKKYNYLMKEMQKKGWLNKEPLDDNIKAKQPEFLKAAINALVENNISSASGMVDNLAKAGMSIYPEDVEVLLGLKTGQLSRNNKKK